MYSHHDGRFLPDRYVIGTCPHCGYTRARGDQCENCTRLLDAGELIEPRSATSGSTDVQLRETRHLFLLQSKLAPELREWLTAKDGWPPLARSIGLKWLDEGLEDRGITRDLDWGVPVERPGFENKVFYVWFDAPIEYIAATREWAEAHSLGEAWRSWWFDVADVHYTQFMAKDNVPFHTVGFPATIIGSREPWKLVDFLKAFNWLTYYGGKFSTSQGVGVFMSDALELLPPDYWRYYLTAHAPESDDSAFSWEALSIAVNKDLADTLGNFVNRSLRFAAKHWGAVVPPGGEPADAERDLESALDERVAAYGQFLERLELRKAMAVLRDIWSLGNAYLDRKKPWATVSTDRADTAVTLRTAANLAVLFARLSTPVIPGTADRIFEHLGVPAHERGWPTGRAADAIRVLAPDHPIEVPPVLFRKLTDDDVATWRQRFGGGMPADG
jgi:methionyl-tRNA synthetase